MKREGKVAIGAALVLIIACFLYFNVLTVKQIHAEDAETITLECYDDGGKLIEAKQITDEEDKEAMKRLLTGKAISDGGFVFAPGSYRIILETPDKTYKLNPYCGTTDMFLVGNGTYYLTLEDKASVELHTLLQKYGDYGNSGMGDAPIED